MVERQSGGDVLSKEAFNDVSKADYVRGRPTEQRTDLRHKCSVMSAECTRGCWALCDLIRTSVGDEPAGRAGRAECFSAFVSFSIGVPPVWVNMCEALERLQLLPPASGGAGT